MGSSTLVILSLSDNHYAEITADQCFRAACIPVNVALNHRNLLWEIRTTPDHYYAAAQHWLEWYDWMVAQNRPLRPEEYKAGRFLRSYVAWVRGES